MKKLILLAAIFISAGSAIAQDTVYFANPSAVKGLQKKGSKEQNIIKIAPLSFISGYIPLYFEREINSFFSLQAGAGVTTRNYLKEWVNNLDLDDKEEVKNTWNAPGNDGNSSYYPATDYTNRKSSLGYYFSIQPRIYFGNEGMEGSFLGISYDRSRYNYSSKKIVNGSSSSNGDPVFTSETFKEYETVSDISANFGTQSLYDRIAVEYTVGVALRTITGRRYAYTNDNLTGQYVDGYSDTKKTTPALTFSIKVGYHY